MYYVVVGCGRVLLENFSWKLFYRRPTISMISREHDSGKEKYKKSNSQLAMIFSLTKLWLK